MKLIDQLLRKSFSAVKKVLLTNTTLSNAIMDVYNTDEFTDLYEHEKMLADRKRVDSYRKGIARNIRPGDVVVDLGTGSGILSLFAADSGASRVYAIDHSDFIDVARQIAAKEKVQSIRFLKVNSRSFNPPEKVDVILHEQIGDDLFDENMISNIMDLKKRVLKKGGRVLPGKFELYLEPVSLKPDYQVPFIWEHENGHPGFVFLKNSRLIEKYKKTGYEFRYIEPGSIETFLCDPEPVFSIDLNDERPDRNLSIPPQKKIVSRAGVMDGVCLYFRAIFDAQTSFDTSPMNGKHSWSNRLFRLERRALRAGQTLTMKVTMGSPLIANSWKVTLSEDPDPVPVTNPSPNPVRRGRLPAAGYSTMSGALPHHLH